MPRRPRLVFPGIPHHVTQRGNRRAQVFFSDADRQIYLGWLAEYSRQRGLSILAYCLMTNHVHLVVVPETVASLRLVLAPLHARYAQRVNRLHEWKGHLWQGRFFASALDQAYLLAAIRYVELNPLRAGMVTSAPEYRWSSARAHCLGWLDPLLDQGARWQRVLAMVGDWSSWLRQTPDADQLDRLRHHSRRCLPCGSDSFVEELEPLAGHSLRARNPGRQPKGG